MGRAAVRQRCTTPALEDALAILTAQSLHVKTCRARYLAARPNLSVAAGSVRLDVRAAALTPSPFLLSWSRS